MHLGALDRLYASAAAQLGTDRLDSVLAAGDLDALEQVLAGFLGRLRNDGLISGADRSGAWRTAVRFVGDTMRLRGSSSAAEVSNIEAGLRRRERLYGQLSHTPPWTRAPLRALPALVIEDLWDQFDPNSQRNPFRSAPDGHTLATVIPAIETAIGANLGMIVAHASYRGYNAPKDKMFKVHVAGYRRGLIGHLKQDHRMGRNFLVFTVGDANNAMLAAVSYNFSLLLNWLFVCLLPGAACNRSSHDQPDLRSSPE
ncbi:hypothetical protein [Mesorhizobium sp. M1348]|uniref:hypothetical protein n=1 Tax=Mesorhizobium sp. M1348 TaxID=2957089 RepID=UPI00333C2FAC